MAIAGMRRHTPSATPKAPTTPATLNWIKANSDLQQARHRLILGAALVGFFSVAKLRVFGGEGQTPSLRTRNERFGDSESQRTACTNFRSAASVRITLRGSKTDQSGQGIQRRLNRSGHKHVGPVVGVAMLLELAVRHVLSPTDPICSVSRARMLHATEISKLLKRAAAATGSDPMQFSNHSLSSGRATTLIAAGAHSTSIKLHGRWRFDVYQRSARYADAVGIHFAAIMAGTNTHHNASTEFPRRWGLHLHIINVKCRLDLSE